MSVNRNLSIEKMTVNDVFNLFKERKLIVNRQYQRKLCWTIEEKQNFIDTLSKGFPVPLFLFAMDVDGNYEIIDGMQRLDAICSFINQRYSLKDGYFNLESMTASLDLYRQNKQSTPALSKEFCTQLANYPLPISIFSAESSKIEEIFKRINSNGRHLSKQELRQVGVNNMFANLVRKLAQEVRGDASADVLNLAEMTKISLSNYKLPYSVNIKQTFWIKNKIFPEFGLRQSRDEEIIALLLRNMMSEEGDDYRFNANILDRYYGYNSNPFSSELLKEENFIATMLGRYGEEVIYNQFNKVFSCLEEAISYSQNNFRGLLGVSKKISDIGIQYQMIFLVIYRLMILEKKPVYNNIELVKSIKRTGVLFQKKKTKEEFLGLYQSVYGILESCFKKGDFEDPAIDNWTRETINILNKSRTEQVLYDFKISLYDASTKKFNRKTLDKVIKTLTAINNVGPNRVGYVIIGVADTEQDAEKYKKEFGTEYQLESDFPIFGVDHEVNDMGKSLDEYTKYIKEYIKNSDLIPEAYREHLIINMRTPKVYGKQLILLKTQFNDVAWYGEESRFYIRNFSDVELIKNSRHQEFFKSYYQQ